MSADDAAELARTIARVVAEACDDQSPTTVADAVTSIPAASIGTFLHASFDEASERALITTALGASPGAASGAVVLSAEAAVQAGDRGEAVILVRPETTPDDVLGMQSARGILTTRGGMSSHAAVVARGWAIPAVVGAGEIIVDAGGIHVGDRMIAAGTQISIDGRTGEVFEGSVATTSVEAPPELETLLLWADRIRAGADFPVTVRANADNGPDAAHARHLGAEGIGLCRTEHMFLADDRLPLMRSFILADDHEVERQALAALEDAQEQDFESIFAAMDGQPVTVRLLDPPLHEFLPDLERLLVAEAEGALGEDGLVELAAVRRLHEVNPMIGTRGVRLGVLRPGLYEMQVRALLRAVAASRAAGRQPIVEIMIPLVVDPSEMALARRWAAEAAADVGHDGELSVGAMIETPRAALVAGELADEADFFSFGTNDLTQLVYAFSRDDVGSHLLPRYLGQGLLDANPFETLDQIGVGRMIRRACESGRERRAGLKIGVCGEQAGDPVSAAFLVGCGVDYVSCSPYRVPTARLAVAQALLADGRVDDEVLADLASQAPPDLAEVAPPELPELPESSGSDVTASHREPVSDDLDGQTEFVVLHALKVKGFAGADAIADVAGVDGDRATRALHEMAGHGWARHLEARDLWQLTPDGRSRHEELLTEVPADEVSGLRSHYDRFLELNTEFKELCNRWQLVDGEPNDHSDADYDAACLVDLRRLHDESEAVLVGFGAAVTRFDSYLTRLSGALARAEGGETRMFTGVMCGSYHDVWMELHEDLIQLLGIDRLQEGSF